MAQVAVVAPDLLVVDYEVIRVLLTPYVLADDDHNFVHEQAEAVEKVDTYLAARTSSMAGRADVATPDASVGR